MSKELTPLEAFVRIARQLKVCDENGRDLDIIETTLKRLDMYENVVGIERIQDTNKKLKALEIIKEKRLAWVWFIDNKLSFEDYNKSLDFLVCEPTHKPKKLTKEEYDLLKEVLL